MDPGRKSIPLLAADDSADADGVAVLDFRQTQALIRECYVARTPRAKGLPAEDGPYIVRACLHEYLGFLEANRKSAKDAQWRVEALILPALGNIPCADLTPKRLREWLEATATTAARLRTKKGAPQLQYRELDGDDEDEQRRKRRATVKSHPDHFEGGAQPSLAGGQGPI